jgi:type II secretory pathway pseudopilin PulG
MMVVVVLIGILTAMIIPEMKGTFHDALLRSTGRQLVSAITLASSRAIALNRPHYVRLDRRTSRYLVERPTKDRDDETGAVAAKDTPGGEGQIDKRITFEIHRLGADSPEASDTRETREPNEPDAPGSASASSPASDDETRRGKGEALAFNPDGTADAAEIVLRDPQGFRLALRINPVTARVRIVELGRE